MEPHNVSVSPATDHDRTIATITTAFSTDPVVRWIWHDPHQYLTFWPLFVRAFAGAAFESGTAHAIDGYGGVAMWLPPGVASDDDELEDEIKKAVPEDERDDVFAFLEEMGVFHPSDVHWYLPLMGVDTMSQGRGYGSALLHHALRQCDEDGRPAYLEATSPQNKALYEQHGFEELGVIQVGGSPPMWPMLRTAR